MPNQFQKKSGRCPREAIFVTAPSSSFDLGQEDFSSSVAQAAGKTAAISAEQAAHDTAMHEPWKLTKEQIQLLGLKEEAMEHDLFAEVARRLLVFRRKHPEIRINRINPALAG